MKAFFKFVEIQTKLASQLPLLLGTAYVLYNYDMFRPLNLLFMFLSLITFDMATTAINNYYDYKKAIKTSGYGYEVHNAIVSYNMRENTARAIIIILLTMAVAFGFLLYLNTSIVVLLLGSFSFCIGILYSFGPVPISRTPFGELFSGGIMGFIIPFLSIYIHIYPLKLITITLSEGNLSLGFDLTFLVSVILLTIPPMVTIANIMLANNLCDMEDDVVNRRYTLPIYIGREKGLTLYKLLYYMAYISVGLMLVFKIVPIFSLLVFATFIPVNKNIQAFFKEQKKATTFALAVKNLLLINASLAITILIGVIIKGLL